MSIVYHIRYCKFFFSFFLWNFKVLFFQLKSGFFLPASVKMLIKLLLLRHFDCLRNRITNCVVSRQVCPARAFDLFDFGRDLKDIQTTGNERYTMYMVLNEEAFF